MPFLDFGSIGGTVTELRALGHFYAGFYIYNSGTILAVIMITWILLGLCLLNTVVVNNSLFFGFF